MARDRRGELLGPAHAALSLRWLALAALIALGTLTSAPVRTPPGFYVVILLYTLGLSLYAWRYADRALNAARVGVVFDTAAIGVGMQVTTDPQVLFYFGFVTAAVAGLLMARGAPRRSRPSSVSCSFPGCRGRCLVRTCIS